MLLLEAVEANDLQTAKELLEVGADPKKIAGEPWGAEFRPDLIRRLDDVTISKMIVGDLEIYDAFQQACYFARPLGIEQLFKRNEIQNLNTESNTHYDTPLIKVLHAFFRNIPYSRGYSAEQHPEDAPRGGPGNPDDYDAVVSHNCENDHIFAEVDDPNGVRPMTSIADLTACMRIPIKHGSDPFHFSVDPKTGRYDYAYKMAGAEDPDAV